MSLSGPTPLQSFLGGIGLALPAQALLSLNHNTFGVSGFIRGAAHGNLEDTMSVLGMISAGFANLYGHPNAEVLERLQQANIDVFRTDQMGAITKAGREETMSKWAVRILRDNGVVEELGTVEAPNHVTPT